MTDPIYLNYINMVTHINSFCDHLKGSQLRRGERADTMRERLGPYAAGHHKIYHAQGANRRCQFESKSSVPMQLRLRGRLSGIER